MNAAKFKSWSLLKRLTYLACAFFVLSYICFDVLDLDGSNFAAKANPVDKSTLVEKATTEVDGAGVRFKLALFSVVPHLVSCAERHSCFYQSSRTQALPPLRSIRSHGYRIALPRSSTPDPLSTL